MGELIRHSRGSVPEQADSLVVPQGAGTAADRYARAIELTGSPEQFAAFVREESMRGARVVKLSGATLE